MTQPELFDIPARPVTDVHGLARYGDPDTAHQAARHITGRTEHQILDVFDLAVLTRRGGFTDDELCAALPRVYPPTVKSARSRLSRKGALVDSGGRRVSRRGVPMIVWVLDPR
jgi:hypothetical protein